MIIDGKQFKDFLPVDDLMEIGFPNILLFMKLKEGKPIADDEMIALYAYFITFLKKLAVNCDVGSLSMSDIVEIIRDPKMRECMQLSFGMKAQGIATADATKKVL